MAVNKTEEILNKIKKLNKDINVNIKKIDFSSTSNWLYDDINGEIRNKQRTFFQITGIKKQLHSEILQEQPIILQNEIGYLGIICKKIDNELHFLMQYKIEPGNINKIQISPTIQATKSNFECKHGGRKTEYIDYFINADKYHIIADQIQSEQSSRFLHKRNRNIIIQVDEDTQIEVKDKFDWMTLRQLKELMRYDNIVNMDTRTVLFCLPVSSDEQLCKDLALLSNNIKDKTLYNSIVYGSNKNIIKSIYHYMNNYKMFDESIVEVIPLKKLDYWIMKSNEIVCEKDYNFKVVFCDITIEGREVSHWCQPLFESIGIALFGLFTCVYNGVRLFCVQCISEIGCFDKIEIGPSVQREYTAESKENSVELLFDQKLSSKSSIIFDTLLSEEGGRFYCEQNRNVIIEIKKSDLELPEGYFWCDYKTLNNLISINNIVNIQLRNLMSVLEF